MPVLVPGFSLACLVARTANHSLLNCPALPCPLRREPATSQSGIWHLMVHDPIGPIGNPISSKMVPPKLSVRDVVLSRKGLAIPDVLRTSGLVAQPAPWGFKRSRALGCSKVYEHRGVFRSCRAPKQRKRCSQLLSGWFGQERVYRWRRCPREGSSVAVCNGRAMSKNRREGRKTATSKKMKNIQERKTTRR